jgi:hypothetical protein
LLGRRFPDGATDLDQLVCDGKTLRGSIEPPSGAVQSSLPRRPSTQQHCLAIAQGCYATNQGSEQAELKKLLGDLDPEGVLIQPDALHTNKAFFESSRSRGPTSF